MAAALPTHPLRALPPSLGATAPSRRPAPIPPPANTSTARADAPGRTDACDLWRRSTPSRLPLIGNQPRSRMSGVYRAHLGNVGSNLPAASVPKLTASLGTAHHLPGVRRV